MWSGIPNYALAWAGLADGYADDGASPPREIPAVREKARAAALRAIALDSTLAEAHAALGDIQANSIGLGARGAQLPPGDRPDPNKALRPPRVLGAARHAGTLSGSGDGG